jgi:outer membrane receptor protein involved in Fe transport
MPYRVLAGCSFALCAATLAAQQPVPADTSKRTPRQIEEITVTAAPARRADAASSLSLNGAELRRIPALNPYDRLRLAGGLEVHDQGQGPGFASDASLRGFSSDHSTDLALWIDGVPINEPVNGHAEGYNDWSLMFPQAIRSIEIFKGPSSPLYGNFALAGAINVRTLERLRGADVELSGGAFGRLEGSVLSGWDHTHSGGVVGLRGLRERGWRPNSSYELGQGHFRVVRDLSATTALDAGIELYGAGWDSPGFLSLAQFAAGEFSRISNPSDGGFKHHAQQRVSLRVARGSLLWRSTLYATQGRWQLFLTTPPEGGTTEGSGSQLEEEDRRYGLGATSALTWLGSRTRITLGAEGRWDHSRYENWFTTDRTRDSAQLLVGAGQASGALFLQSSEALGRALSLELGGRVDARNARVTPRGAATESDTRAVFSPKLGLVLHLPARLELYGNLSRGFRQTDGVIRDPSLPFITAWSYEAGAKLDRERLSFSAVVFRMEVSNEQSFNPLTGSSTSGGASRRQGVELGARAVAGGWVTLTAEGTLLDAKYRRLITEEGDTLSGARVFNTAKFVGSAGLVLGRDSGRWRVGSQLNVIGPYTPFEAPGVTLASYALLHLEGELLLGRSTLQLGVRNLLDHKYPELRAGDFVVPGQPRTVMATLRYSFGANSQ